MSEQNKGASYLNLLQNFKDQNTYKFSKANQQDQELNLDFGLSLGGSYSRFTSGSHTQPQPESRFMIRKFTLNGKPYNVKYHRDDSSCQQQPARDMPLPPDVEAEMNKPKETKAIYRKEAMKRALLKRRPMESQRQLENEGEEEGWHSVGIRKIKGNSGIWSATENTAYESLNPTHVVESSNVAWNASTDLPEANPEELEFGNLATTKNTAHFGAMENLNPTRVVESSNVVWDARAYHPEANSEVIGKSTGRNTLTRCTSHARNVAATMMRGTENPPKKARVSSPSGNGITSPMPMPSVMAVGPTGRKLEGFLCKFETGQVSMVCLCHAQCLSPADFVRHAGWGDVANPMQYISRCFNVHS